MIDVLALPLRTAPVCVIDFETTGLTSSAKAVEVALVRFEKGERVGHYTSFIEPGIDIPAEASAIHGITKEHVKGAPSIEQFFTSSTARGMLAGAHPCAYNASYDRRFMPWTDALWCVLEQSLKWLDPMIWAKELSAGDKSLKNNLEAACGRHGVKLDGAHRALADATATGHLMYAMANRMGRLDIPLKDILEAMHRPNKFSWSADSSPAAAKRPEPRDANVSATIRLLTTLKDLHTSSTPEFELAIRVLQALPELEITRDCWAAYEACGAATSGAEAHKRAQDELMAQVLRLEAFRKPPAQPEPLCIACHEPQFMVPGGITCRNGHGGAESI